MTGGELFVRGRLGVEPTPLGQFVLAKARRVLSEMDALGAETRARTAGAPLRLGCILLVLIDGLIARRDLALSGRDITVDLEDSVTALVRMLGASRYDVIVYGEVNDHEVPLPGELRPARWSPRSRSASGCPPAIRWPGWRPSTSQTSPMNSG